MSTWLLLRGLTRDNRHWGDFPGLFERSIAGARVIALDLPGNGARHREASPTSVGAMVDDCRLALRSRGVDGPVNLLAMSLGAMVAIDWASRYPQQVERCVLINTSLRGASPFHQRLRPQNYARLLLMAVNTSPELWQRSVLAMTSNRHDSAVLETWIACHARHPVSRLNALRQLIAGARFSMPASKPRGDCLLLASTADRLVNVACSRSIAGRWGVPLFEHRTAGHDLPLDDGPWVVAQISRWLAGKRC